MTGADDPQARGDYPYREVNGHRVGPGTVVRHRSGGAAVVQRRKRDDSGWWIYGGGGIADTALTSGDWFFVADNVDVLVNLHERTQLAFIEARNPGIDMARVVAERDDGATFAEPDNNRTGGDR